MQGCKESDTPFSTCFHLGRTIKGPLGREFENPTLCRSIVGGLQYLILNRPDIGNLVNKLSQYLSVLLHFNIGWVVKIKYSDICKQLSLMATTFITRDNLKLLV